MGVGALKADDVMMIQLRICEELRDMTDGGGFITLNHIHALSYLMLGMTEQGLEMDKVIAKLNLPQRTTATRTLHTLGSNPKNVRGGKILELFDIVDDPVDGRFKRIYWAPKGRALQQRLLEIGDDEDRVKWGVIDNEISQMAQLSSTSHHSMTAETGVFKWTAFEKEAWGSSREKPIPVKKFYQLDVGERNSITKQKYWWIDEQTGHIWLGNPNHPTNPILPSKGGSLDPYTYNIAVLMETRGECVRRRGPKGVWLLHDPNTDEPFGIVQSIPNAVLDDMAAKIVPQIKDGKINIEAFMAEHDKIMNKADFNKFRKVIWEGVDKDRKDQIKQLKELKEDLNRKAAAAYRAGAAAEGMGRAAFKHGSQLQYEASKMPVHMLNERQERLAEAQDAIKAGQQKLAEAAVEQAESSILQKQIDELNETNKRNEQMMHQMMKMLQDGFGQGAFGKGAYGGVEVEEDDEEE